MQASLIFVSLVLSHILQLINESYTTDTHWHKYVWKQRLTTLMFLSGEFETQGLYIMDLT